MASGEEAPHALRDFVRQVSVEMAAEYARIRAHAVEDPGTAGDEGEENWRTLLAEWLPANYQVVTKGRILSAEGKFGPQVDVVVLKPGYPRKLAEKKTYIAEGVAAAFECKITLKAEHITKAVANAVTVRGLVQPREGSPYKELCSPIIYGLLSHSHVWQGVRSAPIANVSETLRAADVEKTHHPRDMLDVVCVADLGTWVPMKVAGLSQRYLPSDWETTRRRQGLPPEGGLQTMYIEPASADGRSSDDPIGVMLSRVIRALAFEDHQCQALC